VAAMDLGACKKTPQSRNPSAGSGFPGVARGGLDVVVAAGYLSRTRWVSHKLLTDWLVDAGLSQQHRTADGS
jgi:hypothetical protein